MTPTFVTEIEDPEFQDDTIASVADDGTSFTMGSGWSFGVDKKHGVSPTVGAAVRLYGRGIGYPVRGLAINGRVAFYKTADEAKVEHLAEVAERKRKRREDFEAKRADHDARIAALPQAFRARLDRFISSGPDWRWEFEGYELFCCEEAVRLAAHARSAVGIATPAEWISAFSESPSDVQKKMAPDMKIEEHSGNTFGCACLLARAYLEDETLVPQIHGALAPLVGCKEYGCHKEARRSPDPLTP